MKRVATARDRIRRETTPGASLFPFLAVLICTMGALILLLVVITWQSRLQAAQDSASQNADVRGKLASAREWAQVEIDEYRYSRRETEKEQAGVRLELGHLEDHARRLRDQLARLEATWNESQTVAVNSAGRHESLEAELKQLKAETAQTENDLAAALESGQRRGSYAVVPYQGPHSTRRRPIYIECRQGSVVLQPEGIVFGADDFTGPLGPGNPLEVALRAIREYLVRQPALGPEAAGEPYPLLLVRPDGIEAYYAARAAMKSWASDFGYELIGDDWTVEFQPSDPQMLAEVTRAVDTARTRQRMLLAAAPRRYDRGLQRGYVATPHRGGFVPQPGVHPPEQPDYKTQQPFARLGNQSAPSGGRYRHETSPSGDTAQPGMPPRGEATHQGDGARSPGETTSQAPDSGDAPGKAACPLGQPPCLAKVRGRNWGLPNAAKASVPITSPIRIDCYPDRLVLVPERGLGRPRTVVLGPRTEDSVDELVSNVWDYMERWGSAGNGMYWRPVLTFHVASNAQRRYTDLEALLDQSGLMVRMNDER
ncbi:MAG: hypothetical protein HQ582_18095 [Planctomycetes bacterium]|nr:hypothetical protein [Planctomycetota bacterium]